MPDNSFLQGSRDLPTLIAISLLRGGMDALAARYAKTIVPELPQSQWLSAIASRVWQSPSDRRRGMDWALAGAERALATAARMDLRILALTDPAYPRLLREIPDPPVVLWVQGSEACLQEPSVAVVGSRDATPASLAIAKKLAGDLADAGLVVVSGLARGVDAAAHSGALEAGKVTIAVLGSGLNHIYPKQHGSLATQIARTGAVISELPPDARPLPAHFPLRNRIISGLSLATVVVEASEHSGSLITARMALEQSRDVLAVPGGTLSGRHRGSHRLIKEGARLVESVEDVLDELDWPRRQPTSGVDSHNHLQLSDLEANMARGETYSVDELAGVTGRSASQLLTDLCFLELSGRVIRVAGGRFVRLAGPEAAEGK